MQVCHIISNLRFILIDQNVVAKDWVSYTRMKSTQISIWIGRVWTHSLRLTKQKPQYKSGFRWAVVGLMCRGKLLTWRWLVGWTFFPHFCQVHQFSFGHPPSKETLPPISPSHNTSVVPWEENLLPLLYSAKGGREVLNTLPPPLCQPSLSWTSVRAWNLVLHKYLTQFIHPHFTQIRQRHGTSVYLQAWTCPWKWRTSSVGPRC